MNTTRVTYISSEPSKVVAIDPSGNRKECLEVEENLPRDVGEGGGNPVPHGNSSVVEIASVSKLRISSGIIASAISHFFGVLFVRDNDLVVVLGHGELTGK